MGPGGGFGPIMIPSIIAVIAARRTGPPGDGSLRATQVYTETLGAFPGALRVTQEYLEVPYSSTSNLRSTQNYIEVIRSYT